MWSCQSVDTARREELTPPEDDLRTLIPPAIVALGVMVRPASWHAFAAGATSAYSLTPEGWREITGRYDRLAGRLVPAEPSSR